MKVEIELPEIAGYEYTGESRTPLNGEWFMFEGEALNDRDQTSHYYILRKIPKPEPTLLERIEAAYDKYRVELLMWEPNLCLRTGDFHTVALSMKGFAGYVYEDEVQGKAIFGLSGHPVNCDRMGGFKGHPIAVLFEK